MNKKTVNLKALSSNKRLYSSILNINRNTKSSKLTLIERLNSNISVKYYNKNINNNEDKEEMDIMLDNNDHTNTDIKNKRESITIKSRKEDHFNNHTSISDNSYVNYNLESNNNENHANYSSENKSIKLSSYSPLKNINNQKGILKLSSTSNNASYTNNILNSKMITTQNDLSLKYNKYKGSMMNNYTEISKNIVKSNNRGTSKTSKTSKIKIYREQSSYSLSINEKLFSSKNNIYNLLEDKNSEIQKLLSQITLLNTKKEEELSMKDKEMEILKTMILKEKVNLVKSNNQLITRICELAKNFKQLKSEFEILKLKQFN